MRFPFLVILALLFIPAFSFAQGAPAGVSGNLALWLDASNPLGTGVIPADGTLLNTWYDLSSAGNNATVIPGKNAAAFYSAQINGNPILRFARVSDASGSFYQVLGLDIRAITNPVITVFSVYKTGAHSGSVNYGVWGDDNGSYDRFFLCVNGTTNTGVASFGPFSPFYTSVPNAGVVGATKLLTSVYNGLVTGGVNYGPVNGSAIYFSGQLITSFTDRTDASAAQSSMRIGLDGDNSAYNGDIAEMIVYTRLLTQCELTQVNSYLGKKYGQDFGNVALSISSSNTNACSGSPVTLTATTGGTAYNWLFNSTSVASGNQNTYSADTAGQYQVIKTTSAGCLDTSAVFSVAACTLPITLISFEAEWKSPDVAIEWQTASEQNSDYFAVQRSSAGFGWEEIARVPAAGFSSIVKSYSFADQHPLQGLSYYRLNQADKDGKSTYSKTIPVNNPVAGISIYPNPAKDMIWISGIQPPNTVTFTDNTGRQFTIAVKKAGDKLSSISISTLSPGMYFLKLNGQPFKVLKN